MTSQYGNFDLRRRSPVRQAHGGRDRRTGSSERDRRVLARRAERRRADTARPIGLSALAQVVAALTAALRRTGLRAARDGGHGRFSPHAAS